MAGSLVGRDEELATVVRLLTDPTVRIVVLTGPSGVGKTRLAVVACQSAVVEARVVVPLSAVQDGQVMADAVVAATGAEPAFSERPADALWRRHSGDPVLLLLDNLEQVHGAAAVVTDLLEDYPAATVLATCVRALGVAGEHVVKLGPLRVPDETPSAPESAPALQLFVERAQMRDVTRTSTDSDLRAAARICRAVGGLPLAVELAAARAGTLPLSVIAAQLSKPSGLRLLDRAPAGAPKRHRSLEAALSWTIDLLPPEAADLLAAMSVFDGAATLEAIMSIAPSSAPDGVVLDLLSSLLDVALVGVDSDAPDEPLFALLPPVRWFARQRLDDGGRRVEVIHRLDQYVRARCRSARPLRPYEMADVLAALDRALLAGSPDAALELALHVARVVAGPGARASVASRVEELLDQPTHDAVLTARALVWSVSHVPADVRDREAFASWTLTRVQQAVRTARSSGDAAALLDALELTIRTLPLTLDMQLARAGVEEGLEVAERHGDPARLARFRMWVGMATLAQGLVGPATGLLRAAFLTGCETGDRIAADYAATFLHAAGAGSGDPHHPLPRLSELVDSAWQHGDAFAAAMALGQLVTHALDSGDLGSAADLALQLLPIGADRATAELLPAATILTVGVRVLVAADRLDDAAAVHRSLAPVDPVLRNALSRAEHLTYMAAVERLAVAGSSVEEDAPADAAPSLPDGFRRAERAILRWQSDVEVPPATTSRPLHGEMVARPVDPLTARERQVLWMLTDGSANRQIAEALGISSKTVMHHTVSIYRKLGVRGRTEAVAWAVRSGMSPAV
jgi:predicted ATPase/DNA-binding CsgD family transcriptional regulator